MPVFSALSYNVHECVGMDGRRDPCRIADVIKESGADIIGLQEVHSESDGRVESHQMNYLASCCGLRAVPGRFLMRKSGEYGNVLLTRFKILNVERLDLTMPGREPRGAIDADVEIGGDAVRVIVTHLGLRPHERRFQANRLLAALSVERTRMVILLSDFNEWLPSGRALRHLEDRFGKNKRLPTFPSPFPLFGLDRIWVSPPSALIDVSCVRTPLTRIASDHLPLIATIRTPEPEVVGRKVRDHRLDLSRVGSLGEEK
ncbi:MAG TPA: endonuclease/exonuclease/phosphatase family protein [Candidatus Binatia bacterium]|jgi:endonuclease/exonuclease/phosphatase family metal-dependent hydrolase